jgi:hypothetical protein
MAQQFVNLVTPKAGAMHELLFNKQASYLVEQANKPTSSTEL